MTTTEDRLQSQKESDTQKAVTDDCSTANQADKISPEDSNSDGVDGPKGRPMSPGTLALMCDEQDTMFMSAASPNGLMGDGCDTSSQLPNGHGMTEVYAEQERIVLAKFRGCLNMLITRGELKGKSTLFLTSGSRSYKNFDHNQTVGEYSFLVLSSCYYTHPSSVCFT